MNKSTTPSKTSVSVTGYHKSAYAGLSEEELEEIRALRDDFESLDCIEDTYERFLFPFCVQGAPRFTLAEILEADAPGDVTVIARCLGIKQKSGENLGDLGLRICAQLKADRALGDTYMGVLVLEQLIGLRKLYEQGGVFTLDLNAPVAFEQLPPLVPLACYAFREGGTVTFVMPVEMRSLFAEVELDRVQAISEFRWGQIRRVEALACLHGIIPLNDVIDVLKERYPAMRIPIEQEAFAKILFMHANSGVIACYLFATPVGAYFVDPVLAEHVLFDDDEVPDCCHLHIADNLPEYFVLLLEAQSVCDPRPLEEVMVDRASVIRWVSRLPAMRALRGYLEERVPDGEDDLDFVDDFISWTAAVALSNVPGEEGIAQLSNAVDGLGKNIAGGTAAPRFRAILRDIVTSVPLWVLRGWTATDKLYSRRIS